jgi:hypothetical protein
VRETQSVQPPYERMRLMLRGHGALISVDDALAAGRIGDGGSTSPAESFVIA